MTPPGYIKSDFGADFSQKWQIPILCYCLKVGIKYHIKHFEDSIMALQGFSQVLDIIHLYVMFQNPKPGISVIFVNFVNLNLTDIFTEDLNFHFRFFYLILKKIREFYLSNGIKMIRIFHLICPQNCGQGFKISKLMFL